MKTVIQIQFIELINFNYNPVQNYIISYYAIMTSLICQKYKN